MYNFRSQHARVLCPAILLMFLACASLAQTQPASAVPSQQIDQIAQEALAATGVPSASIAVVKDGKIAYVHAYGNARLDPSTPAHAEMRYSIGSISKQFTAAAILFLQEQGKLSLDDKVSRFIPNLTRANEVTIRQLLSHTSGYQDYWPQDYVPPFMLQPTSADGVLQRWARIPLDFDPGAKWQYSNTNYVIAGVVIEKASGMPLLQFLKSKIFAPLSMESVMNVDQERLTESDPTGYMRYALGPPRVAPKEGKGWLFAAGELAMTAEDLAKWDISLMNQTLLKPASYKQMETNVLLNNGTATGYGLGIGVDLQAGHRALPHGGAVSGFTAENVVFPDNHAAVVVLTNMDAAGACSKIANQVARLLLPPVGGSVSVSDAKLQAARRILEGLQQGKIDRALFTSNANIYFNEQAISDFASSLGPLGAPQEFTEVAQQNRGGMGFRAYRVKFGTKTISVTVRDMPDGTIEQYLVAAAD